MNKQIEKIKFKNYIWRIIEVTAITVSLAAILVLYYAGYKKYFDLNDDITAVKSSAIYKVTVYNCDGSVRVVYHNINKYYMEHADSPLLILPDHGISIVGDFIISPESTMIKTDSQ